MNHSWSTVTPSFTYCRCCLDTRAAELKDAEPTEASKASWVVSGPVEKPCAGRALQGQARKRKGIARVSPRAALFVSGVMFLEHQSSHKISLGSSEFLEDVY